jgi:hypothetical protein
MPREDWEEGGQADHNVGARRVVVLMDVWDVSLTGLHQPYRGIIEMAACSEEDGKTHVGELKVFQHGSGGRWRIKSQPSTRLPWQLLRTVLRWGSQGDEEMNAAEKMIYRTTSQLEFGKKLEIIIMTRAREVEQLFRN